MITTKILFKPSLNHVVKPVMQRYLTQERLYNYKGMRVIVSPGVFHPGLFQSTKCLLKFVGKLDLSCKTLLEVGSGSGIVSIAAANQNAAVTAIDVNTKAVRNTAENAILNGVVIKALQSDMFENLLTDSFFEVVVVNPPIFTEDAENIEEQAWYCGKNGEFFQRFFHGIKKFTDRSSQIYMVIPGQAPQQMVLDLAANEGFEAREVYKKVNLWETNSVWQFRQKINSYIS